MAEVAALQQLAAPKVNAFKWTPRHLSENKFPEIHMRSISLSTFFDRSIFFCCQNSGTNAHPGQLFPGRQNSLEEKAKARSNILVMVVIMWVDNPRTCDKTHMGLSENSVPLHPMVNDHYPY